MKELLDLDRVLLALLKPSCLYNWEGSRTYVPALTWGQNKRRRVECEVHARHTTRALELSGVITTVAARGPKAVDSRRMSPRPPASRRLCFPLCVTYKQQKRDVSVFRVTPGEDCVSSWRQVGGDNSGELPRSGGVAGGYLKTRRQVAGQLGVAGFTHSGQPGQRLGLDEGVAPAARRQLCWNKAAGEGRRESPLRAPRGGGGRMKALAGRQRPHLPFSIN